MAHGDNSSTLGAAAMVSGRANGRCVDHVAPVADGGSTGATGVSVGCSSNNTSSTDDKIASQKVGDGMFPPVGGAGRDGTSDLSRSEIRVRRTRRYRLSRAGHGSINDVRDAEGQRCHHEGVIGGGAISKAMEGAKVDPGNEQHKRPRCNHQEQRHQRVRNRSEETIARRKRKKELKMAERKRRTKTTGDGGASDEPSETGSCRWSLRLLACALDRCLHTGKVSVVTAQTPADTAEDSHEKEGRCRGGVIRTTAVTSTSTSPSARRPLTRQPGVATHWCECDGASARRTMIRVRPLLVLDVNGILCHRVRVHRSSGNTTRTGSSVPPPIIPPPRPPVFRKACGYVANTHVVPRTDLLKLLTFLDANFTLAVWSSAKKKTVNRLVKLLFPPQIAGRLLFVWGQNRCCQKGTKEEENKNNKNFEGHSALAVSIDQNDKGGEPLSCPKEEEGGVPNDLDRFDASAEACLDSTVAVKECPQTRHDDNGDDDEGGIDDRVKRGQGDESDDEEVVFVKSLDKVWCEYPLWDESNTVLVDDSPQKCPERFRNNAIHPPPILGHQCVPPPTPPSTGASSSLCTHLLLSDEANQAIQGAFFARLAEHWRRPEKKCCSCGGGCAGGDVVPQAAAFTAPEEEGEEATIGGDRFSLGRGSCDGCGGGKNRQGFRATSEATPDGLHFFLKKMATGHMGWIGG